MRSELLPHLALPAPLENSVSSIAKQLKGASSLRLFAMHPELRSRYWKRKGERPAGLVRKGKQR